MSILLGSVTINPNSTGGAHTKSSWQTIATPSQDIYGVTVVVLQSTSNGGAHLFDIGYGATPTVVVKDYPGWTGQLVHKNYLFDVLIPSGQALKFRTQYSNANSSTITWYFFGHTSAANRSMFTSIECLNANNATTAPTATLTGNSTTANTEGSWVEIVASLSADASAFHIIPQTDNVTYAGIYLVDVTTGASGSEATSPLTITENFPARRISGNGVNYNSGIMTATVTSGTRIAARLQADTTAVTSRDLPVWFVACYGGTSGGGGSTTIIQGNGMQRLLKDGETNAGRKTIPLEIRTSAGAIYNANGETCRIKTGTGAWGNCTNTIVGTADGNEITLTDAEAAAGAPGDIIQVYAAASGSHLASPIATYEVTSLDPSSTTLDVNVTSILGTAGSTTELSAVPAINASFWDMLKWMFSKSRNKVTQTASTQVVYKDDGSTTLGTSTTSDNGTTATRGEFA